jgi:hypothetical protein
VRFPANRKIRRVPRGERYMGTPQRCGFLRCIENHTPYYWCTILLAHLAKGNVSFCHHLASVVCCLSSVNFSHFNLLLWNPTAIWTETW